MPNGIYGYVQSVLVQGTLYVGGGVGSIYPSDDDDLDMTYNTTSGNGPSYHHTEHVTLQ